MTTAKIKIDLSQGIIEAEGSESFVMNVYSDFKEKMEASAVTENNSSSADVKQSTPKKKQAASKKAASAKAKKKPSGQIPSIVKTLDLSGGSTCERLKEFYAKYEAKSNFDKNLIFIYYLDHKLGLSGITVDHIFTCYRDIPGIKVPEALRQSLLDTNNRKGWIDTSDTDNLKVTTPGVNYLEHDMPSKGGSE